MNIQGPPIRERAQAFLTRVHNKEVEPKFSGDIDGETAGRKLQLLDSNLDVYKRMDNSERDTNKAEKVVHFDGDFGTTTDITFDGDQTLGEYDYRSHFPPMTPEGDAFGGIEETFYQGNIVDNYEVDYSDLNGGRVTVMHRRYDRNEPGNSTYKYFSD